MYKLWLCFIFQTRGRSLSWSLDSFSTLWITEILLYHDIVWKHTYFLLDSSSVFTMPNLSLCKPYVLSLSYWLGLNWNQFYLPWNTSSTFPLNMSQCILSKFSLSNLFLIPTFLACHAKNSQVKETLGKVSREEVEGISSMVDTFGRYHWDFKMHIYTFKTPGYHAHISKKPPFTFLNSLVFCY